MFGSGSGSSLFGTPSSSQPSFNFGSSSSLFGRTSSPATGTGLFGSSTPGQSPAGSLFGAPSSSGGGLFGGASTPSFGATPTGSSLFGAGSTPAFGATPSSTPSLFGASAPASGSSLFGSNPAFGQSQPSLFSQSQPSLFGQSQPSLFSQSQPASPFGQAQSQPSIFGQTPASGYGQSGASIFGAPQQQQTISGSSQLLTQMAPVAPLVVPLPDQELLQILEAYKDDPTNQKYRFRHLFLSVTHPQLRFRPPGVPEDKWQEALRQLEGMDSADRERLWPELAQGFRDLSRRLRIQDETLASDAERLRVTETNMRALQRHFETDTVPRIQKVKHQQKVLQRRLLRHMRIVQALELKGLRMPLTSGEAELAERLRNLAPHVCGPAADLPRRADGVLSAARLQSGVTSAPSEALLGNAKIEERSLDDMRLVLSRQTEAIGRLTAVLKKDARDLDIIFAEGGEGADNRTKPGGRSEGVPGTHGKRREGRDFVLAQPTRSPSRPNFGAYY